MPAQTHSSSRRDLARASAGVDTRLPWWALALPVLAFGALFLLITGPDQAQAVSGDVTVSRLLEQLQTTLSL
ncbi:hypothetical protein [Streptomyces showdoensis]|uniref:Uncharacterized protein n=1 Tax=Streptomyces showdoensis TaxID=68268 RepID=A0A2P2GPK5_STREW|nr:hypothetical protein [Streptomyces showdoensis]KKZ73437.1 hypothetical protein VO63_13445 [Streptomyces showdoensis]